MFLTAYKTHLLWVFSSSFHWWQIKNIRQVLFTVSVRWTAVDLFALTTQGHLRLPLPLWQTTFPSYAMTSEALLSHLPRTVMVCLKTWLIRRHCHRKKHENTCKTCWDVFVNISFLRHNDPYKPVYFHLVSLFSLRHWRCIIRLGLHLCLHLSSFFGP